MSRQKHSRNAIPLVLMIVIGLTYLALLAHQHPLAGTFTTDGIISVLLGLYICSHPVANILDVLLFRQYLASHKLSTRNEVMWWILNGAALFTGWYIIFVGMLRFSAPRG